MARVTEAEVKEIIDVDPDIVSLTPFITIANELVTEVCGGADYTDARLKEIERWLSAHCVCIMDPRATSSGAKGVTEAYQSKTDLGLNSSHYGQMAMRLDTAGGLAALENNQKNSKGITPNITWLGKKCDE